MRRVLFVSESSTKAVPPLPRGVLTRIAERGVSHGVRRGAFDRDIEKIAGSVEGGQERRYLTTQSADNAMTASQFQAGFESTRDSAVLITGITSGFDGRPAADVTFTSRQQPHDGPEGESCTNWHVTMYFDGSAGTYTIGAPPNGYKAAYQACPA